MLDRDFGGQGTGISGTIVFRADQGVDDPEVKAAMEALFAKVATLANVNRVDSPYSAEGDRFISSVGPQAGKIAYANVEMPDGISLPDATDIREAIRGRGTRPSTVSRSSSAASSSPSSSRRRPSCIGLAFAIVILILAFGSVLAMGLPIGVALFGVGIGIGADRPCSATCCHDPRASPRSSA